MSEPKRSAFLPACVCLIVLMSLGWPDPLLRASSGAQPPGSSAEDEQRKIEARLKRRSQPEVRREWQLLDDLGEAAERYYWDKDASSRSKCESMLAEVLAQPKPSAKAYSACAATASMLGRPREAIEIVKKAIAAYPDESIEGPILPLKVSGYYRIGALATRVGDPNEAARAYKTIIRNAGDSKGKEYLTALCYMYLADLARRMPDKEHMAAERLQQVVQIMESVDRGTRDRNDLSAIDLMKDWAAYELTRLEHAGTAHDSRLDSDVNRLDDSFMIAAVWAIVSCPSQPELEQMAESDRPSVLRDLAGLGLAIDCLHRSDPFKAEKYLLSVAQGDSYFKAQARIALDAVREEMRKIREKIPALLDDLKHGSVEQQEQAASQLVHNAGSEGINALLEAQADGDKRVRCLAACALAQSPDRSVRPKFDVILEAFTDDDPRMRDKAQLATAFHSCVEIGPREMAALIRLMHEHYSKELWGAVQGDLVSSGTKQEIKDAAVPELVGLINHENSEVRERVLDLLAGMVGPPAQATPALAQRLDREQDRDAQMRIIAMLGRIGPAAREAVPVLIRYTRHDDVNVRRDAIAALKQISPADAAQIPETAGEP